MLCITRKIGESVQLFTQAGVFLGAIKLVSVKGETAKIAFETPTIGLVRSEIQSGEFKGRPERSGT